jgi:3'-phosphoadenosine 5'-phosphosulfate sulfotransferase (PAPS reductase)/FAD synthetase
MNVLKSPKRKMGRPKIHKNHAAAQRAYRRRQKEKIARDIRQAGELRIVPLHHWQANELVQKLHRHHSPIKTAKFSIGCTKNGVLVGCAMCGRPAARSLDDGTVLEVCRLVSDGTDNVPSLLYARCAKIARLMGFAKIQTYILDDEPGISLKGAGWVLEAVGCGGTLQGLRKDRPRGHVVTAVTLQKKQRWAKTFF